jgi:hypothetical protein
VVFIKTAQVLTKRPSVKQFFINVAGISAGCRKLYLRSRGSSG